MNQHRKECGRAAKRTDASAEGKPLVDVLIDPELEKRKNYIREQMDVRDDGKGNLLYWSTGLKEWDEMSTEQIMEAPDWKDFKNRVREQKLIEERDAW